MKRVLLTGAGYEVGALAINFLLKQGFEVFALTHSEQKDKKGVKFINTDFLNFDNIKNIFKEIKPQYLLHLDWYKESNNRLAADLNFNWFQASLEMLKQFNYNGGKRAVYTGTCFEYELKDEFLTENTKISPVSDFAKYKVCLNQIASLYSKEKNISFGWGRIFSVYGEGEFNKRNILHIIKTLSDNMEITVDVTDLVRDYMFECDIAGAFSKFLDSNVEGSVNICSKIPMKFKDFVYLIEQRLNRHDLINFNEIISNEPKVILGDNTKMTEEIKYIPSWTLASGLEHLLKEYKLI